MKEHWSRSAVVALGLSAVGLVPLAVCWTMNVSGFPQPARGLVYLLLVLAPFLGWSGWRLGRLEARALEATPSERRRRGHVLAAAAAFVGLLVMLWALGLFILAIAASFLR